MNVLVKILLKLIQPIVEGMISGASVFRRGEVLAQITNLCKQGSCGVVLLGHHGNRIGNRTKAVVWLRAPIVNGSLQFGNMWKQDELFLCQVLSQFLVELCVPTAPAAEAPSSHTHDELQRYVRLGVPAMRSTNPPRPERSCASPKFYPETK